MRNLKTVTILSLLLLLGGNAFVGTVQAESIGPLVTINFDNLLSPGQSYSVVAPPPAAVNYPQGTLVPTNAQLESVVTRIPASFPTPLVNSVVTFSSVDSLSLSHSPTTI